MGQIATGCGSVWLERHVGDVENGGSNPPILTKGIAGSNPATPTDGVLWRMSSCAHDTWERFTDLPPFVTVPYWKCPACGVLGRTMRNGSNLPRTRKPRIAVIRCSMDGCTADVVGRLPGLSGGRLKWVCAFHLEGRPGR